MIPDATIGLAGFIVKAAPASSTSESSAKSLKPKLLDEAFLGVGVHTGRSNIGVRCQVGAGKGSERREDRANICRQAENCYQK